MKLHARWKCTNGWVWAISAMLLAANVSAQDEQTEYVLMIPKAEEPSAVINLAPLQQSQLRVGVAKRGKPDEKAVDGTEISTTCGQDCTRLLDIRQTSVPTRNGIAVFDMGARENVGSQLLSFNAPGAESVAVKISIAKPAHVMTVKGLAQGKALNLRIGEENPVEVEVKEGNAQARDGTIVRMTIMDEDDRQFFDSSTMESRTINGTATFYPKPLKPKSRDGKVIMNLQTNGSITRVEANISRLPFYQAVVSEVLGKLLGYVAILAAIGTVSMGLLEAFKWNDIAKGNVQSWLLRRRLILSHTGFMERIVPPAETGKIAADIIKASYGACDRLRKNIFYRQTAEKIIAQTKIACKECLENEESVASLKAFIDKASPLLPSRLKADATDDEMNAERKSEEQRRIENLDAYFDAVLVDMNSSWKVWNQLAAVAISMAIIGAGLYYYSPYEHGTKAFILAFFGGLFAPMAKDFTNSTSSIINRIKG